MAIPYTPTANASAAPAAPVGGGAIPFTPGQSKTPQPPVPVAPVAPQTGSAGQTVLPGSSLLSNIKALPGALVGAGKNLFNTLSGSEQAAGQDIAGAVGGSQAIDQASARSQQKSNSDLTFVKAMNAKVQSGQQLTPTQHTLYTEIVNHIGSQPSATDAAAQQFPALNKSNLQVAGDFAGVAADAVGAGTFGKAAKTAETGKLLSAAPTVVTKAKDAISAAQVGSSADRATKLVQGTEDTLSKSQRLQAMEEGRVVSTPLGGKTYNPAPIEQRAGEILAGKLSSNPVKNIPVIKQEIATRGAQVENFLTAEAKPVTAAEQHTLFSNLRAKASKILTDSELQAYDEQIRLFSKQLPGRGGYNTANFYKGLKDYETNVADRLARGKAALLDPTGIASAKLHAASDVRTAVRDLLAQKHPQFKPQMYDLASLYDAKSTMLTKADQLEGNAFTRLAKGPLGKAVVGGAALLGVDKAIKGTTGLGY